MIVFSTDGGEIATRATAHQLGLSTTALSRLPANNTDHDALQMTVEARRSIVAKYRNVGVNAQWMRNVSPLDIPKLEHAFDLGRALGRDYETWIEEGVTAYEVLGFLPELEDEARARGIASETCLQA